MVQSLCPRCGKQTDGSMVDHDLYIFVICDKCEVILGILPKYYQKATWKAGRPRGAEEEIPEPKKEVAAAPKEEPGASVLRALEREKRTQDRKLRWS